MPNYSDLGATKTASTKPKSNSINDGKLHNVLLQLIIQDEYTYSNELNIEITLSKMVHMLKIR